jgi:hypothetical protein
MSTEGFLAETVDEQIDQYLLSTSAQRSLPEACVVQDLHEWYMHVDAPEQVRRSLDAIWARLADQVSPAHQTLFSMSKRDFTHGDARPGERSPLTVIAGQAASSEQTNDTHSLVGEMIPPPARARKVSRPNAHRTLILSALAALLLLGVFSWVMVNYVVPHGSSVLGSGNPGPGTPGLATPVPATPAPQNLREQVRQLLSQFHQEVSAWGSAHQYFDKLDGKKYALDYAYGQQGIGGMLDSMVNQASSTADFQAALDLIQAELTNLHAMEKNSSDPTPWKLPHSADSTLMSYYKLNSDLVIVVSLLEQSMRVYQNGKLLQAFLVTTGRYEMPTLPGAWKIETRQTNVTLQSSYPKDSLFWFPPTPVHYALQFHTGGYLIYDSLWRASFGPGTQFPHLDAGGQAFANNGSQGGISLSESKMASLYNITQVNTPVIIY